ncbi:MAG: T9SS type A sorting domain-containing protein [Bacteroidetes bacterium]|nr:T9SS type A sorting domain-containing protein [Bacteroidota bacterium]
MKLFAPLFMLLACTLPLAAQQHIIPYNSVEPREQLSLYRDSERWVRERYRWFREHRVDEHGNVPEGVRENAWRESSRLSVYRPSVALSKEGNTKAANWINVGPHNIGGRLTGIAIHPMNPDIVYFTAADGGVWKTVNGTSLSFEAQPISDDLPTLAMGSIDLDPNNPDIIYVGTGEANGSADSYPGVGVIRSTDAGATWEVLGGSAMKHIGSIRVHKTNGNIIIAASRQGLYRSMDSGQTWVRVRTGIAHDLVLHPTIDSVMYAAVQGTGVLRSSDNGATWEDLDMGIGKDSIGRIAVDLCLTQPGIMYALLVGAKGPLQNKTFAVMRSTNAGTTWERTTSATNPPSFTSTYGWFNCEIAVHPTEPNRILCGGVGLYLSMNGGQSFQTRGGIHVDHHAIEYSPSAPDICYDGNDGGLYISGSGGISFISLNANLPITQFYELGISLLKPDMVMGGTQDNGSNRRPTSDGIWEHETGGDGAYCILDYSDTLIMYAEYQNGSHLRSTDGGKRWTGLNKGLIGSGLWVTPMAIHPTQPEVLFTATTKQLYKTTNRGDLWVAFHSNMDSSKSINYIAISPHNPDIMLVGYTNGRVWVTTDAGTRWENVSNGLPARNCTDIIFDPVDINTVYASFTGYTKESIYRSTDLGQNWTQISSNLPAIPVNALEINPGKASQLFAGTDFGVYTTLDGGETWDICGDGMPKVVVVDLELHPATGMLYAATHGRSTYALQVTTSVQLLRFSAQREGGSVRLDWQTSFETESRGFGVERASGSGGFEEIAFVPSEGASAGVRRYGVTDDRTPTGITQLRYRLKMVGTDGSVEYSQEIPVEMSNVMAEDFTLDQNYPNPFNPATTIRYSLPRTGHIRLSVTDALGTPVRTLEDREQHPGAHHVIMDASDLPNGAYFYHLEYEGVRVTRKMLLMK